MTARVHARSTHTFAFLLAWLVAPASHAILVEYEALDLADTTFGADLWRYNYYVSDYDFLTGQGFTVRFNLGSYDQLAPASASPDWDALAAQPDPLLPDNGFYDALAQVDHANLVSPFSVQFFWLGNGAPGSQVFDLYNLSSGNLVVTDSGNTVLRGITPVPLPASLWLMLSGIAAAWWARRRGGRMSLA